MLRGAGPSDDLVYMAGHVNEGRAAVVSVPLNMLTSDKQSSSVAGSCSDEEATVP